jgi:peptidoglycan/LPS O-acetylase OafA/YrhL
MALMTAVGDGRPGRRWLELDSLRGIAALLVVLYHYTSRYPDLYGVAGIAPVEVYWGIYGVDLFFIISGYVIFMTLERVRHPLDFVVSRLTRLYPAYWACLLLTALVLWWLPLPGRAPSLPDVLVNLTMLQFLAQVPDVDGVYWTLAIELCFYAALLLIFLLRLNRRITLIAILWLAVIVAGNLLERWAGLRLPPLVETCVLLKYGQLFWIGIFLYHYAQNGLAFRYVALILAALGIEYAFHGYSEGSFVLAAVLAFVLAIKGRMAAIRQPVWLWLGAISYPLYLLHQNIGYVALTRLRALGLGAGVSLLVTFGLVLALASAVTFLIERPAMAWLRRRWAARHRLAPA